MASSTIKQTNYSSALSFDSTHEGIVELKASGNVGIVYGYFICTTDGSESVKIYIPDGFTGVVSGIVLRDQINGTFVTAWTTVYTSSSGHKGVIIETYGHSGTMVVGHPYNFAVMVRK